MEEIEFPQSVCINSQPHGPHRIAGTWRTDCPGLKEEVRGLPVTPNHNHAYNDSGHVGDETVEPCRTPSTCPTQTRLARRRRDRVAADIAEVWRMINAPQGFRPVDVRPLLDRIEREFYTPAAGDADRYNEHGQQTGYVHPSAG